MLGQHIMWKLYKLWHIFLYFYPQIVMDSMNIKLPNWLFDCQQKHLLLDDLEHHNNLYQHYMHRIPKGIEFSIYNYIPMFH